MGLKEILQKIVKDQKEIVLNDGIKEWATDALLTSLPEPRLSVNAYFQSGLYIVESIPKGIWEEFFLE
jgi:hypothetical protein